MMQSAMLPVRDNTHNDRPFTKLRTNLFTTCCASSGSNVEGAVSGMQATAGVTLRLPLFTLGGAVPSGLCFSIASVHEEELAQDRSVSCGWAPCGSQRAAGVIF